MQTIQLKTPEILEKIKWNENSQLENFRKFKYTPRGCPLFRKFWKMLFHSPLEFPDIQAGIFGRMEGPRNYKNIGFSGNKWAVLKKEWNCTEGK